MGKRPRIKIKRRSYRGVVAEPTSGRVANPANPDGAEIIVSLAKPEGQPDERGLYDWRTLRFAMLDGEGPEEILLRLVNLPDDAGSLEVRRFIDDHVDLAVGGTDSEGRATERMGPEKVLEYRNRYRQFWLAKGDAYKSNRFLELLAPWPEAFESPISKLSEKDLQKYLDTPKSTYPHGDYRFSAIKLNWKTGQWTIAARGPVDTVTHAVFKYRNKLRQCLRPKCRKFFIAAPHQLFCSSICTLEGGRERKRKWKRKRDTELRSGRRINGT